MFKINNIFYTFLALLALLMVFIAMTGCKCPCAVIPGGGTHQETNDSVHTEYIHDSIYTDRWHTIYTKGDTVFVRDSIWRDRWHYKQIHDSVYINNTDTIYNVVEVEKKGAAFWKGSGIALWVLIGALVLAAIIGIIIKFAK